MKKIAGLLLSFILIFGLSSCGGLTPTETVNDFLLAVQNGEEPGEIYADKNFKPAEKFMGDQMESGEYTEAEKEMLESIGEKFRDFDFTLDNEKIKGEKATVDVTFTTYNFGSQLRNMLNAYLTKSFELIFEDPSEEELEKMFDELAAKHIENLEKNYTETVTISLTETDGTWVIDKLDENGDVVNALLGDMINSMDEFNENMDF